MSDDELFREMSAEARRASPGPDSRVNGPPPAVGAGERSLATLLDTLVEFVRRFVVMSHAQAVAVALWIVHTHAQAAAETTPYLAITSPVRRSGKSRLFEVLSLVVAGPMMVGGASIAYLFRSIDKGGRTVLFDEVDAIFSGPRGSRPEGAEDLRGLLNNGHRRLGGTYGRMEGQGAAMKPREYNVFCPKALAGIGDLPDTVTDRSIPIALKRAAPGERRDRFRHARVAAKTAPLRDALSEWASDEVVDALRDADPELPPELNDRAADGWEPLLAIADRAGGGWPTRAREAALILSADEPVEGEVIGVRLLADVRTAFDEAKTDRLKSKGLVAALVAMEEAPWGDLFGKPLTPQGLAVRLRSFGIVSGTIWLPDEPSAKGYRAEQFDDAWRRYLPALSDPSDDPSADPLTTPRSDPLLTPGGPPKTSGRQTSLPMRDLSDFGDVRWALPETLTSGPDPSPHQGSDDLTSQSDHKPSGGGQTGPSESPSDDDYSARFRERHRPRFADAPDAPQRDDLGPGDIP